jgi:hypothetical protein
MVQHTNAACGCESIGVMKGEVDSSILSGSTSHIAISLNNLELVEIVATNPSLAQKTETAGRMRYLVQETADRSHCLSNSTQKIRRQH